MTDIVERLRQPNVEKIRWDAADEIERLRLIIAEACEGLMRSLDSKDEPPELLQKEIKCEP